MECLFNNLHDINGGSPARDGVPIERIHKRLRRRLKKILRPEVWFPQSLAHPEQLLRRRPAHDKVFRLVDATDQVHVADVRGIGPGLQPGDDRLDEERPKAAFVQHVRDERAEHLGRDLAVLLELEEVLAEAELLTDRYGVGGEARKADVEVGAHFEDFREISGDGLQLDAKAFVSCDGDAAVAFHRNHGATVVRQYRLKGETFEIKQSI